MKLKSAYTKTIKITYITENLSLKNTEDVSYWFERIDNGSVVWKRIDWINSRCNISKEYTRLIKLEDTEYDGNESYIVVDKSSKDIIVDPKQGTDKLPCFSCEYKCKFKEKLECNQFLNFAIKGEWYLE